MNYLCRLSPYAGCARWPVEPVEPVEPVCRLSPLLKELKAQGSKLKAISRQSEFANPDFAEHSFVFRSCLKP